MIPLGPFSRTVEKSEIGLLGQKLQPERPRSGPDGVPSVPRLFPIL